MGDYIKLPVNYIGNKYKLIPQIATLFPETINTFVDVCGGSGTVLLNVNAEHFVYNDVNPYVKSIIEGIVNTDYDSIIRDIKEKIRVYSLNKTNREGFERLRNDYNSGMNDWLTLYVLMCYSFNYQFRFNTNHEYNSSFGKNRSCFSDRQSLELKKVKQWQEGKDIVVSCKSLFDIDYTKYGERDLLYFDPPYLNSVGNYNDGKRGFEGWTAVHERSLCELLDTLNNANLRWALSNNFGYVNDILEDWLTASNYKVHKLEGTYTNCNYHKRNKETKGMEVLITNY